MSIYLDIEKELEGFTLNMQLEADDIPIALLGASGSGKSMTLRCIAGVEKPDRGTIILNGQCVFDSEKHINLPPQERGVGLLFQNYALFPTMTVRQNILCGARRGHQDIEPLITQFGLEPLQKRLPHELSGGQQQRVALARILASRPRILLLDEPFSALDSFLRWQVEQQIAEVIEAFTGTTILVSHNREEAYRLCQQIAVVHHGRTSGLRDKKDLFDRPRTQAEARLIGMENVWPIHFLPDGRAEIPALGYQFTPPRTDASAIAVSGHALTSVKPSDDHIVMMGHVSRVLPGPSDTIVLITPTSGTGMIHWCTEQSPPQVNDFILLYLPKSQIHFLT